MEGKQLSPHIRRLVQLYLGFDEMFCRGVVVGIHQSVSELVSESVTTASNNRH